jgi:predicted Zn finger-like uncharacterized protein
MALATRCPNCHALFRVAADQLKLRGGLVRCSACRHVFDATGTLSYIDDATLSTSAHATAPAVGAVIAAIRKAESSASESLSAHGLAPLPSAPTAAQTATGLLSPAEEPAAGVPTAGAAAVPADVSAEELLPAAGPPGIAQEGGDVTVAAAGATAEEDSGADEPAVEAVAAGEEAQPIAEPATPAFLREADAGKKRRRTVLFGIGALLLVTLLLVQLAAAFRAEILVKFPQARPALAGLCKVFRCTVSWPARGELLAVVGSELQALPGTSAFELTAVVRNRGNITLALPAIELTLSDTLNRTVARKVFSPSDYLAGESDPPARLLAGLEAGADLTVRIAFEARGVNAAGFVVYPFYL